MRINGLTIRATTPRHTDMRGTIAFVLASLLIVQSLHAQQPVATSAIRQSIAALPPKAHVALHLTDGNTLLGRIASRADHDFVLKPDSGGAPQTISYDQVTAVEQIDGHSKKKWIIVGVVAAVVVVVAIIAIHAKKHPLGNCCGF
jgi:hypothetical protein